MRSRLAVTLCLLMVAGAAAQDYAGLQNTLLRFYRYQRAGTVIGNPGNPFYTRTPYPHASDSYNGSPLDGGWYDAGDFVKFGLNLGFSAYCLLKGYDVFPGAYDDLSSPSGGAANGIPDILDEAKVATDYLIKAVVSESYVVRDVGDGNSDHTVWASGYDHRQARTVYQAEGADIPGMYAASLALMSKLYRQYDATYANTCLAKARTAFTWCTRNQKLSSKQYDYGGMPFYDNDTWKDKMACGAVELYRATNEQAFLVWAKDLMAGVGQHYDAPGYANCGDFAAFELYRLGEKTFAESWFADLSQAQRRVVSKPGSMVDGAFVNTNWGVCATAGNSAFSASLAYMVTGVNTYRDFAIQQVKWIAGFAPYTRSWIVRYGNGPTHPHHRNDDCLSIAGVDLTGGVVSGPTPQGGAFDPTQAGTYTWVFNDVVSEFRNTEVALNYNAGITGATAFIRYYNNPPAGLVRIEQAIKCTPDMIDFNAGNATISATFERSIAWKIIVTGRSSGAVRTFTGTGISVSQSWGAEADNGSAAFISGEIVDLRLDVPNIAEYHVSRSVAVASIASLKDAAFLSADVLVDDFNDADLNNKFSGPWSGYSDSSDHVAGGVSGVPVIYSTTAGKSSTRGANFRLTAATGAARPYAGVRTVFNAAGTDVSLGQARSLVFDVQPGADSARFRVELAQSGIADRGYHGVDIRLLGLTWQRIRIPISRFEQPSWASAHNPLDLNRVNSLRFALYGAGTVRLTIDNVHIEGLSIGPAPVTATSPRQRHGATALAQVRGATVYVNMPVAIEGSATVRLTDAAGRVIASADYASLRAGQTIQLPTANRSASLLMLTVSDNTGVVRLASRLAPASR